jgi:hypothetical protein
LTLSTTYIKLIEIQGINMNYRNPKILKAAQHAPCMVCGSVSTTVAAHSNQSIHGKGMGIKAHDCFVAFLCAQHHSMVDGQTGNLTRQESREMWASAHDKTILFLLKEGIIV